MKQGALVGVLCGLGAVGYFGYDWWQKREVERKEKAAWAAAKKPKVTDPALVPAQGHGTTPDRPPVALDGDAGVAHDGDGGPEEVAGAPLIDSELRVVPDLVGLNVDQAKAAVVKAGFAVEHFSVSDKYACAADDKNMKPVGEVCAQKPKAGTEMLDRFDIMVTIEKDTFEGGARGTAMEWRRMPKLEGMTEAAARAALTAKGFGPAEFAWERYPKCGRLGAVCKTRPAAGERKVKARAGTITISD